MLALRVIAYSAWPDILCMQEPPELPIIDVIRLGSGSCSLQASTGEHVWLSLTHLPASETVAVSLDVLQAVQSPTSPGGHPSWLVHVCLCTFKAVMQTLHCMRNFLVLHLEGCSRCRHTALQHERSVQASLQIISWS